VTHESRIVDGIDKDFFQVTTCDPAGQNCAVDKTNVYYRRPVIKNFATLAPDTSTIWLHGRDGFLYIPKYRFTDGGKIRRFSIEGERAALRKFCYMAENATSLNLTNVEDIAEYDFEKYSAPSNYCPRIDPCDPSDMCYGCGGSYSSGSSNQSSGEPGGFLSGIGRAVQSSSVVSIICCICCCVICLQILGLFGSGGSSSRRHSSGRSNYSRRSSSSSVKNFGFLQK
jgi:hypothetical protein